MKTCASASFFLLLFCIVGVGAAVKPGDTAPSFTLPDIHGRQFRLDDYRGRVVVLNFWAFWCDTWKAELPHMKELAARQGEMGFQLLAVSVDGKRLPEFLKRTKGKVPFPVLLDPGGKVSAQYGIAHVPTVVILDREGRARSVRFGYPGNHVVLSELRKLTAQNEESRK
jgi:peroxiredoxin